MNRKGGIFFYVNTLAREITSDMRASHGLVNMLLQLIKLLFTMDNCQDKFPVSVYENTMVVNK